jgi:hypothetical protein
MDQQIAQRVGIGVLALAVGVSGWLLPYRWNLLRLRRGLGSLVPEHVNRVIPKVIGSILIVVGAVILIATAAVGRFQ